MNGTTRERCAGDAGRQDRRSDGRRRRRRRPILVTCGLAASLLLAACGSAGARTTAAAGRPTVPTTTPQTSRAAIARAAAQALQRDVTLPPGARAVPHEPAGDHGALREPSSTYLDPDLVDVVGFAVLPGSASADIAWVTAHLPAGSSLSGTESAGGQGAPVVGVELSWPAVGQVLDTRTLVVAAVDLTGGGSAMRLDAEVTWLPPKPAGDLVPPGAQVLTVVLSHGLNSWNEGHAPTTTTDLAVIRAIVERIDSLPVMAPGLTNCPADWGQALTLTFRQRRGGPALAVVVADPDGCQGVTVTEAGHTAAALQGWGFASFVESEIGWHLAA